ncbi:MAG: sigma-70 family RNA polymerase sigma factor [Phycisphaerales bacterium]|nr:MAG: sigma-70 family RNA polymerase sigma factor [Phycisphaerales bacterium]
MDAESTCWTMIHAAARGSPRERESLARCYEPVIRAYLRARWRGRWMDAELDDAVQEVFVEVYRKGGVLERVDPARPGGFRAFLYGVLRHVALRAETQRARRRDRAPDEALDHPATPAEDQLSRVFDRAWARSVVREAAERMAQRAADADAEAVRRVELLRLRFHEGLPIRDIAARWNRDAVLVHRDYARARKEFKRALIEVMSFYHPGAAEDAERECAQLLAMLA